MEYLKKSAKQIQRERELKDYLQTESKAVSDYVPLTETMVTDEKQLSEDRVSIGKKKTWKPNEEQKKRNKQIEEAQDFAAGATADTLMIRDTIKQADTWAPLEEHALQFLLGVEFKTEMLTSANIRAHFGEYMQIVRAYDMLYNSGSEDVLKRLAPLRENLDLFYKRMEAFCEQNRVHINGEALEKDEVPAEFHVDKDKLLRGEVFRETELPPYAFGELDMLEVRDMKEMLTEEEKERKMDAPELSAQREKLLDHYVSHKDFGEYDTAAQRIADIRRMREELRYLTQIKDTDALSTYRTLKPSELILEIKARLVLAEAEARYVLAHDEETNLADILADQADAEDRLVLSDLEEGLLEEKKKIREQAGAAVAEAWEDYRLIQRRQIREQMPLSSSGRSISHMSRFQAIHSGSDAANYAFKARVSAAADALDESVPALRSVKDLAKLYAQNTHYTISQKGESSILMQIRTSIEYAEKQGLSDSLADLKKELSALESSTLPAWDQIPEVKLKDGSDAPEEDRIKLDFHGVELSEKMSSMKGKGGVRNFFLNNSLTREWVDVSKEPLFAHEPTINDLRQGKVSNCYMLAATTSLIQHDPQAIKRLIRDNGDGTATVRLYRGPGQPVFIRVDKKVPRLRTGGAILTSGALWMQLIEMAAAHVGMFRNKEAGVSSLWYGTGAEWYGMLTGLSAQEDMESLYSSESGEADQKQKDAIFERMRKAADEKAVIHMGTKQSTSTGMNSGHAYTVLGVKEAGEKRYVTLRNPYANMSYGHNESGEETMSSSYLSSVADETCGQFDIPFEEFLQNAELITLTKNNAYFPGGESPEELQAIADKMSKIAEDRKKRMAAYEASRREAQTTTVSTSDLAALMEEDDLSEEEIEEEEHEEKKVESDGDGPSIDSLMADLTSLIEEPAGTSSLGTSSNSDPMQRLDALLDDMVEMTKKTSI
ncbi:MAG: hypothetical protein K6E50_11865 [Lachnospiraceae bacterium]|nr:hypothetical protein [Lachnospiraceae bacterium]